MGEGGPGCLIDAGAIDEMGNGVHQGPEEEVQSQMAMHL